MCVGEGGRGDPAAPSWAESLLPWTRKMSLCHPTRSPRGHQWEGAEWLLLTRELRKWIPSYVLFRFLFCTPSLHGPDATYNPHILMPTHGSSSLR